MAMVEAIWFLMCGFLKEVIRFKVSRPTYGSTKYDRKYVDGVNVDLGGAHLIRPLERKMNSSSPHACINGSHRSKSAREIDSLSRSE